MARTTILVGYDAHPPADRALARAVEEARRRDGRLVVLAVAQMPLDPQDPQNFGSLDDSPPVHLPNEAPPEQREALAAARRQVDEAIPAEFVWAIGEPASSIVEVAREKRASLVVLGEHHHGRLGRLFGADTAQSVADELGSETIVVA